MFNEPALKEHAWNIVVELDSIRHEELKQIFGYILDRVKDKADDYEVTAFDMR